MYRSCLLTKSDGAERGGISIAEMLRLTQLSVRGPDASRVTLTSLILWFPGQYSIGFLFDESEPGGPFSGPYNDDRALKGLEHGESKSAAHKCRPRVL